MSGVFTLLASVYAMRTLQPTEIGRYNYVLTFVTYFVSLATLGIPVYGVREIAKVKQNSEEKNHIFSELFIINFCTSCLSFAIYLLAVHHLSLYEKESNLCYRLGLLIVCNVLNVDWLYKGEEEYGYIAIRSIVIKLLSLVLLVQCVHNTTDIERYADITVLVTLGNYIHNVLHARHYVKFTLKGLHFFRHIKPNFILAITVFFSELYNKIDVTMLGTLASKYAVGIYSNAHELTFNVISCSIAATGVFLPRISSVLKDNKQEATRIINKGLELLVLLCIPLTFGLCALSSKAVLFLYGESYSNASITINILAWLIIIRGIGDLVCYQLQIAAGLEKMRIPASILTAMLNIAMNWMLIPSLKENGAAIASVMSELFVNGFIYIRMKKVLPFSIHWINVYKTLIASVTMYAIVCIVAQFDISLLPSICISVVIGVLVFVGISLILRNDAIIEIIHQIKSKLHRKRT